MVSTDGHRQTVAIYARTWLDDRPGPGWEIVQQVEAVREACDRLQLEVIEVYRDENVSESVPLIDRPGGWHLISDARAGRFTQVVVYDLRRLGTPTSSLVYGHLWLQAAGVTWRALTEELDTASVEGQRFVAALCDEAHRIYAGALEARLSRGHRPSSPEVPRVAALFASDDDDDPGLQLAVLHRYAHERGWLIGPEYVGDDHAWDAVLMDAHDQHSLDNEEEATEFDLVLFERLDRLGDVGAQITIIGGLLDERMPFVSVEEGIDTSTPFARFAMEYAVQAYHTGIRRAHEAIANRVVTELKPAGVAGDDAADVIDESGDGRTDG